MERRMTIRTILENSLTRTIAFLFLFSGLILPIGSHAQQKHKADLPSPQTSRYVKEHIIDAGDVPGHQLRIVEVEKIYTKNNPVIKGVKVSKVRQWAFTNYIDGVGPVIVYEAWSMEDGNTIFLEGTALTESRITNTGSRRGSSQGILRIVGGTGKFASIQGLTAASTQFDSDPDNGYNRPKGRIEYWDRE